MKVLDLQCAQGHRFEGWFGSEAECQTQLASEAMACPLCGDSTIHKRLSAPRLNLGHGQPPAAEPAASPVAAPGPAMPADLQAAWLQMARQVMAQTEDVGPRFAEEARRIQHGEVEARGIRGQASRTETAALLEEGITVLPLPIPDALKNPLH